MKTIPGKWFMAVICRLLVGFLAKEGRSRAKGGMFEWFVEFNSNVDRRPVDPEIPIQKPSQTFDPTTKVQSGTRRVFDYASSLGLWE